MGADSLKEACEIEQDAPPVVVATGDDLEICYLVRDHSMSEEGTFSLSGQQEKHIKQSVLSKKFQDLSDGIRSIMGSIDGSISSGNNSVGYEIDQIELHLNLTASGNLAIVSGGGEAGIKLVLRKRNDPTPHDPLLRGTRPRSVG